MNTSDKIKSLKKYLKSTGPESCKIFLANPTEEDLTSSIFLQLASDVEKALGNHQQALFYAQHLRKQHPEKPAGFAKLADAFLSLELTNQASETIEQGLNEHPESPLILQTAIQVARAQGDLRKSAEHGLCLIKSDPNKIIGFQCAAKDLLKLQNFSECLNTINNGLFKNPGNLSLLQLGVEAARAANNVNQIVDFSQQLIKYHPKNSSGFTCLAQAFLQTNMIKQALSTIDEGLDKHPENHLLLQLGIEASRLSSEFGRSFNFSRRYIALEPDDPTGYRTAAGNLIDLERYVEAQSFINEGLEKQPENIQLLQLGIEAFRGRKDIAGAINFGKELILRAPEDHSGYINTSRDLAEAGKIKEAESIIKASCRAFKNNQETIHSARSFYRDIGLRKKSLQLSRELCSISGNTDANLLEEASDLFALGRLSDPCLSNLPETIINKSQVKIIIEFLRQEEMSDYIPPHIRLSLSQLKVFNHFNGNFNPLDLISKDSFEDNITICVVHVGKCAGESILNALHNCFDGEKVRIVEFHIFDAKQILAKALDMTKQSNQFHWIILTRDPIARWVSAFNWDQHVFHFNRFLYGHKKYRKLLGKHRNASDLINKLMRYEKSALATHHFEHLACGQMQMSQAWYLPEATLHSLPRSRTSVIRTENINHDFQHFIQSFTKQMPSLKLNTKARIDHTKANYQNRYKSGIFTKKTDLNRRQVEFMKDFLKDDYRTHNLLTKDYLKI